MTPSEALQWHHPLLDQVDVSNALAPPGPSANEKGRLRVVVANIERGTRTLGWLQTLKALDPDIVLMNEADWGMARSANRHVARVIASELETNYMWAIELVELTPGTKSEAWATRGIGDAQCFTGNGQRDPLQVRSLRATNRTIATQVINHVGCVIVVKLPVNLPPVKRKTVTNAHQRAHPRPPTPPEP